MAHTATELTLQRLENLAADKTVSPPVMRRGLLGKADDGKYYNLTSHMSADGDYHLVMD